MMPEQEADLLKNVTTLSSEMLHLRHRLYGEDWDTGDIPALREHLREINGFKDECNGRLATLETDAKAVKDTPGRLAKVEGILKVVLVALVASGILAGSGYGIADLVK